MTAVNNLAESAKDSIQSAYKDLETSLKSIADLRKSAIEQSEAIRKMAKAYENLTLDEAKKIKPQIPKEAQNIVKDLNNAQKEFQATFAAQQKQTQELLAKYSNVYGKNSGEQKVASDEQKEEIKDNVNQGDKK